jgi:DNA-binding response OmpR family regulator
MESVPVLICSARTHVSERVKGLEFGADDYLRLSYATSMKNIEEGLNRIEEALTKLSNE